MDIKTADRMIQDYLSSPEDFVIKETVDGIDVVRFVLPEEIVKYVELKQNIWRSEWNKHIEDGEQFPYVTHPEVLHLSRSITELFLEETMSRLGVSEFEQWASGKAYDVGQRVMIPDAYWLIGGFNAKLMADFLRKKGEKKKVTFRSIGTGAGVYERSIYEQFSNFSTLTTDISIHSCVISALNLEMYNVGKKSRDKISVYLVKGRAPVELLKKDRTVVVQIADCIDALKWDKEDGNSFNAVGLDNFLPYLPEAYVKETFELCLDLLKADARIQFLGLDKTRVIVGELYKIGQIIKGGCADRFKKAIEDERNRMDKEGKEFLFGYEVVYKTDSTDVIREVKTVWAGNIFDWVREYIFSFRIKDALIMNKAIKSATGLSTLSDLVISLTADHFKILKVLLEERDKEYDVVVSPGSEREDGKKVLRAATIDVK